MTDIQELLIALRAKGWTLAAIATELEVNYHTVKDWLSGRHAPSNVGVVRRMLRQLLQRKRIPKQRRYTTRRTQQQNT
jgi:transcriptional regulator with XRE-family HTH domain